MHFTKENLGNISANNIPQVGALHGRAAGAGAVSNPNNRTPSPEAKDAEESLQSKYQKYSQLAKQLSCYDGTNWFITWIFSCMYKKDDSYVANVAKFWW